MERRYLGDRDAAIQPAQQCMLGNLIPSWRIGFFANVIICSDCLDAHIVEAPSPGIVFNDTATTNHYLVLIVEATRHCQ
ncbi:hypothetical protein JOB18_028126 [Solea senegalensis]|uniref:Uncharacterized protein n=1 Tax=Solea senegalensis TaxID=28829 RepID=A0AAV6RER4_SOLSE|nr:hypothetical protein JOB18_028126 [Solea senegalensis]